MVDDTKIIILCPAGKFTGLPACTSVVLHLNKWLSTEVQALALKSVKTGQDSKKANTHVQGEETKHMHCVTGKNITL